MKQIKLAAAAAAAAVLISACGSGSESSTAGGSTAGTSTTGTSETTAAVKNSYADVRYDLSQAFKDFSQAAAKLDVSFDNNGAVYNDRQKLLIDKEGSLVDFIIHSEPADLSSSCILKPIKPSLDENLDNLELLRISNANLYLMHIEGFPAQFNEQSCQFKENDSSKEETVLVNENGDITSLDFTIDTLIPYSQYTRNYDARTLAITEQGDVYRFDLDNDTKLPKVTKIASTDNSEWYYHSFELLATKAKDGLRFNIYDLAGKQSYDYISKVAIKEQGVGYKGRLYFSTWDDQYYILEVEPNFHMVITTAVERSEILDPPKQAAYELHDECKFTNKNVADETIYHWRDESLFESVPQELKSQEIFDSRGQTNFLTCRSYNGQYLAALNVQKVGYGIYDFAMQTLYRTPDTQLIAGSLYTKAGENAYNTSRQKVFKLVEEGNQIIDLSKQYELPENKWVSGIQSLDF
ncbi:hypothetical protein [Psychromonas aquimarina]|uniref:hypothetical protein n=1 Tax=Psychromonas aquimarina TaxID=444919 RepID=UPI00042688BA|nr:hypothetical protein [Psychromonas aquimarina]